jgi:hypothetical protein
MKQSKGPSEATAKAKQYRDRATRIDASCASVLLPIMRHAAPHEQAGPCSNLTPHTRTALTE